MAVGSGSVANRSASGKKEKLKSSANEDTKLPESENGVLASPGKRSRNSTEVRVVGGRIYDPVNGKSCHQCRQKTMDFVATCKNQKNKKPCTIMFCHKCLSNRYGEKAEEVSTLEDWCCPKCRDICNCSICMKKRGHQPTGILINTAKATGYSSVSDMLLNGSKQLDNEKPVADSPKKVATSPGKRGKENSLDGKVDMNLPNPADRKSKKVKVQKGNIGNNTLDKMSCIPDNKIGSTETGSEKQLKKKKRDRSHEINSEKSDKEIRNEASNVHEVEKKQKKSRKDKLGNGDGTLARKTNLLTLNQVKNPAVPLENGNGNGENGSTGSEMTMKKHQADKMINVKNLAVPSKNGKRNGENGSTGNEMTIKKHQANKVITVKNPAVSSENGKGNGENGSTGNEMTIKKHQADKMITVKNLALPSENSKGNGENGRTGNEMTVEKCQADKMISVKTLVVPSENGKGNEKNGRTGNVMMVKKHQAANTHAEIPLPLGIEFNTVGGVEICAENVGNALQFLEFCAVFGKVIDVKKGQPEHVLQDLFHGRTGRRGKFSLSVQFHINLLSIILSEEGEEYPKLSPSHGKDSWFSVLKRYVSESQNTPKAKGLDCLDNAADYDTLKASEKLMLINFLCDELLGTEKLRNWMDGRNAKHAEMIKEAKQKVTAARDEEKCLKQKMKDDMAKAIIDRQGAPLSISEHDLIISDIKQKAAEAHAKVLESKGMLLKNDQHSNVVRTEPIFVGIGGDSYWKLNCMGKAEVLRQKAGKRYMLDIDDKWFIMDDGGKDAIEKLVCSSR